MPVGVNVFIDGKVAEVEVLDPRLRAEIAGRLVAAARPNAWRIDTVSLGRPVPTFRAPVEIVEAAGLIDHPSDPLARVRAEIEAVELAQFGEWDDRAPLGGDEPPAEEHEHVHWGLPPRQSGQLGTGELLIKVNMGGPEPIVTLPPVPPRTGRGSGRTEWQQFLTAAAIPFDPEDSRADLIARWDEHPDDGRT